MSDFIKKFKEDVLKNWRFPLFTAWFGILLEYKLAYEFVKHKGLSEEFKAWCDTEGQKLVETFFKEGLEILNFFKEGLEILKQGQKKEGASSI